MDDVCVSSVDVIEDAAPLLGCERRTSSSEISRRLRRRGPRSQEALQRRASHYIDRRCPEICVGKDDVESSSFEFKLQPIRILSCNIRSLLGKSVDFFSAGNLKCEFAMYSGILTGCNYV